MPSSSTSLPSHPLITIQPPRTPSHIQSLRRLNTAILPVRYPPAFYTDLLGDENAVRLTRVAILLPSPSSASSFVPPSAGSAEEEEEEGEKEEDVVVGAIRCRLEPDDDDGEQGVYALYIQTLAVTPSFRRLGVARMLLDDVLREISSSPPSSPPSPSPSSPSLHPPAPAPAPQPQHHQHHQQAPPARAQIKRIRAHVWINNDDALEWYRRRGFVVRQTVLEGFYRRLKPAGARVVVREL